MTKDERVHLLIGTLTDRLNEVERLHAEGKDTLAVLDEVNTICDELQYLGEAAA